MTDPCVYVVHSIDTEGPLGGDARRNPDGSAEFFDSWDDILVSLAELTAADWRSAHCDSFGDPYRFNWFIMDFTGFATNPKCRVAEYHDTWDRIHSLPVELDGRYWHYHVPPANGAGDQWSESWLTSNECNVVLARRLLERGAFPAAFRAGGTIEDDAASRWLEEVIPIDYSNRVSDRSVPTDDLYRFNWFGAPDVWGGYHPSRVNFLQPGDMRRYVYRCIDYRSRYNDMTEEIATECFLAAKADGRPRVLSFFSHDTRDMRPETYEAVALLRAVSEQTGVPWRSATAVDAHCAYADITPKPLTVAVSDADGGFQIDVMGDAFQLIPFVAAELRDGRFARLFPRPSGGGRWKLETFGQELVSLGVAVSNAVGVTALQCGRVVDGSFHAVSA